MEATITTLGDVLKTKLLNEIEGPTIWVDRNGNEHSDLGVTILTANPETFARSSKYEDDKYLCIDGFIKQVGSTVTTCGPLVSEAYSDKQYPYDLSTTFKYAKSLESLVNTFDKIDSKDHPLEIPEDLFWNCPNLQMLERTFIDTWVKSIPPRLFERCRNLKRIFYAFLNCKELTTIPGDLFKYNKNIKDLRGCFSYTGISEPPKELLDPLVEESKRRYIDFNKMFFMTPFSKRALKQMTPGKERGILSKIRKTYFPNKFNLELVHRTMGR